MEVRESEANMIEGRSALDKGFVTLVDMMGNDYKVLQTARVSTGGEASKGDVKDRGLIRYLYKNEHSTPFESVVLTWHVKAPIFVVRQWFRHRTWSFNEYSGRYSKMIEDTYTPTQFHYQDAKNHQASGSAIDDELNTELTESYDDMLDDVWVQYQELLEEGVAKEQARMILPVTQYTEFYGTVNLRNLFQFLDLRLDSHAQFEIREYATAMLEILEQLENIKWSVAAFKEFNALKQAYREAINASGKDTTDLLDTLHQYTNNKTK